MTRTQFQDQFEAQVELGDDVLNLMTLDQVMFDTPVYRALERLIIVKDDGKYYMHL